MLLSVGTLPDDPLDAAARFHGDIVPVVLAALAKGATCLTLHFAPASQAHDDWRRAALATLAREKSPARINAVVGDDSLAVTRVREYLEQAPGVTGQYLETDALGAG